MSVLGNVLKGAALGSVMAGSAAMAEDVSVNDLRLSRSDWLMLDVVKDFNTCIDDAQRTWLMPSGYRLADDYNQMLAERETYRKDVIEPYNAALAEYRDQNGWTQKIAEAYYRLERVYPAAKEKMEDFREYGPELRGFAELSDRYDLLLDQSKAEFDAVTTLEIPTKQETSADDADAYYDTVIKGCAEDMSKGISEWVNSIWSDLATDSMATTLKESRFRLEKNRLKAEIGVANFLELTQAP